MKHAWERLSGKTVARGMMSGSKQITNAATAGGEDLKRSKRRWSMAEKIRIAEASLKAGACSKAVAQANGAHPSQLYKWRRLYRRGLLSDGQPPVLLPVCIAETTAERARSVAKDMSETKPGTICIELARARVIVEGKADAATLGAALEHLAG
jgi:transposase